MIYKDFDTAPTKQRTETCHHSDWTCLDAYDGLVLVRKVPFCALTQFISLLAVSESSLLGETSSCPMRSSISHIYTIPTNHHRYNPVLFINRSIQPTAHKFTLRIHAHQTPHVRIHPHKRPRFQEALPDQINSAECGDYGAADVRSCSIPPSIAASF